MLVFKQYFLISIPGWYFSATAIELGKEVVTFCSRWQRSGLASRLQVGRADLNKTEIGNLYLGLPWITGPVYPSAWQEFCLALCLPSSWTLCGLSSHRCLMPTCSFKLVLGVPKNSLINVTLHQWLIPPFAIILTCPVFMHTHAPLRAQERFGELSVLCREILISQNVHKGRTAHSS